LFITNGTAGSPVCSNTFTTTAITTNSWVHIALVYNQSLSSGNATLFINGVASGSANKTGNSPSASNATLAAELFSYATGGTSYAFNGYASNLRITNSAVYSSAFTPSTTPLTVIANTQLLTFQSNRFVDNSTNAYAIVPHTTQSIQRFNPFGTATAYSTSVIGGSASFNGTTDSLSLASNAAFQFGTGDFTVEGWFYQTADNTYPSALEIGPHVNPTAIIFITKYGGNATIYAGGFFGQTPTTLNAWNHIAWVRSSGSLKIYVNGVSPAGVAFANNLTDTTNVTVGKSGSLNTGAYYFSGNISNLRVVKGTAVYTANFTPPTTPLTAISGTSLLLSTINGAIFDNAMMNNLQTAGNAQISTSVKKYGTGSLAFDGTDDYLISNSPTTDLYAFGTGNFTIEFWLYLNSTSSVQVFYDGRPAASQGLQPTIYINSSGTLFYYTNVANQITGSSLSTNTWYHIAVSRSGSSTKMFVNGTQVGSTYTDSTNYVNGALRPIIGADGFNSGFPGGNAMNGYIDDLRITKGYARYTANFTPPSQAFSNTGPV
jgi:hypothetical protein